jgi:nucleotide-binding universal stress UspA family protein
MSAQILVPVDGSEHAFRALNVACVLARAEVRSIRLLHVVPNKEVPTALKRYAAIEHMQDPPEFLYETAIAENVLNVARDKALAEDVQDVECSIEHGEACKGILKVARRDGVDTIVMGTRGLSDFQGIVFGSVARKVAHGADCRVIVVK